MASKLFVAALLLAGPALAGTALIGPGVGNADALIAEGTRLYNTKAYAKASDNFLAATRANPTPLPPYLQLARSYTAAKQLRRGCYVYRVYLKAAPESPDRKKAQAESDQCERQLKNKKKEPPDMSAKYVDTRAAFFTALEKTEILGKEGAAEHLSTLIRDGYVGPDLADMGAKLGAAAIQQADEIHKNALANEKMSLERLRNARPLYQVATDVGATPQEPKARVAFLDGLASLQEKDFKKAERHFTDAARADSSNKEYHFYRGLALLQGGERTQALKVLEQDLKDDPRTQVLRTALAIGTGNDNGAQELERLLFSTRYPPEK